MLRLWDILYAYGVDVALAAHDHNYERFAPQTPDGVRDDTYGIPEFVVGTGGAHLRQKPEGEPLQPNSLEFFDDTHGVLTVALGAGRFAWAFLATDGSQRDPGEGTCHGPPATPPRLPFELGL
jgi:hypothetical protein